MFVLVEIAVNKTYQVGIEYRLSRLLTKKMANLIIEESKRENDEDNITKRLNKAFESRLDLDRVSFENGNSYI